MKSDRGEWKRSLLLFLGFVLLYTGVGIPAYLLYQRHRTEEAAAERAREAERDRANVEEERRGEIEDLLRRRSEPPAGIRGPNAGRNPYPPRAAPAGVYDHLPAEQRRMLQPGSATTGAERSRTR